MDQTLNDTEVRVLGSLIEKEITTPDYYPLSLNALVAACNQSSNRHPVAHFDEETVAGAADSLREKKLVHLVDRGDSRVAKYRHVLYEAMSLGRPAIAVMCVLMLRGPQTVGEIRTRSNRLYDFSSLDEVELTVNSLMSREPALIVRLPRQSGQKEVRYAHLLSGEVKITEPEAEPDRLRKPEAEPDRLSKLEKEVEDLKEQFEQFRKQFE
ncbi:MAG TPA: YceH family protein [Terriglobia bacterium]|nr:YceH family protein [Terriglobia bacterium]